MKIRLGSAFAGIGGFELGLHWAIPNLETVWQIEQDKFCQKVLRKHWPNAQRFDDITTIDTKQLSDVDMLCAGFPCQDLSYAGKGEGINGKKSGLFWELWRIVRDFKEEGRAIPILLLENVPAILNRGLGTVLAALSEIGYDAEWFIVSAKDFGAPHLRKRWFCVATYADSVRQLEHERFEKEIQQPQKQTLQRKESQKPNLSKSTHCINQNVTHAPSTRLQRHTNRGKPMGQKGLFIGRSRKISGKNSRNYWKESPAESPICSVDDGISNRLARLRALGNAIVPQCSEWIGHRLIDSGLLEDVLC